MAITLLALLSHSVSKQWVAPDSQIVALGAGPVGAAFFLWDYGVKHGNIQLLGTLS